MQIFANNAFSTLAASILATDTSISLQPGTGARFPTPTGGDFFLVTLFQLIGGIEANHEIVKVTARSIDTLTIVRAQESTTARAWGVGDQVSHRGTAGTLGGLAQLTAPATFTQPVYVPTASPGNNTTQTASTAFVTAAVTQAKADLVASSPTTLDTLNELALALGNDANFATTTATALGNRLRVDINTQGLNSTQKANAVTNLGLATVATTGAKADVGLSNVDNTSDANKPVSTATATALALKVSTSALAASSGSSLSGFIQAGSGMATRTAQDKLRERVSVMDSAGIDPTGVADSTAAFSNAAKTAPSHIIMQYENINYGIPMANVAIIKVPAGTYKLTSQVDTGNREIIWEFEAGAVITGTNDNFLGGRVVYAGQRTVSNLHYGTRDYACGYSVIANTSLSVPAAVIGFTSPSNLSAYPDRDSVGFYVENHAPALLATLTAPAYTATTVTCPTPVNVLLLRKGMIIDTAHSPKFSGMISGWAGDGSSITVTAWYPADGSQIAGTPSNGVNAFVNPITKIWAHNANIMLDAGGYATQATGFELGVFNFQSAPASEGANPKLWGYDSVNLGPYKAESAFIARAGAANFFKGFESLNNDTGFYQLGDGTAFKTKGNGTVFQSIRNSGVQNYLITAAGSTEAGSTDVVGSVFYDFHTSGNNIDYDVRILATGGSGTNGQGTLVLYAAAVNISGAIRPSANGGDGILIQRFTDSSPTGSLLRLVNAANTVDLAKIDVAGNFSGNDFTVNGRLLAIAASAGFEMGSSSTANTPFIDFHSSGNSIDYDARIIASGGSGTVGQGTLQVAANLLNVSSKAWFITDSSPLDYSSSRSGFVVQHRDTASGATNELIPGAVFQFNSTGDGTVTSSSEFSQTIWQGLFAYQNKTGDGSAHCFTGTGQLGAVGAGGYNELGLYQGEMTNVGSSLGTMSGVEILLKDSPDGGATTYSTKMQAVVGRIAKYNPTTRKSYNFFASSEGTLSPNAIIGVNSTGLHSWQRGFDFTGAIFTTGQFGLVPNNVSLAWVDAGGSAQSIIGVNASNELYMRPASSAASIKLQDYAGVTRISVAGSGGMTVISGSLTMDAASAGFEMGSLSTANTPFIDFHSSGNNIDYDARIIANGGNTSAGNGTLSLQAAIIVLPSDIRLTGSLSDYTDDTAAAAGGIVVGKLYRTGSVLKIRVS